MITLFLRTSRSIYDNTVHIEIITYIKSIPDKGQNEIKTPRSVSEWNIISKNHQDMVKVTENKNFKTMPIKHQHRPHEYSTARNFDDH